MKIAYITTVDVLGPANDGGVICATRNLTLLKDAFGNENIFICAITKKKEHLSKTSSNTAVFYCDRPRVEILKDALYNRFKFGKAVEDKIIDFLNHAKVDTLFIEMSDMGVFQERLCGKFKQVLFMQNLERDYIKKWILAQPKYILLKRACEVNEALAIKHSDVIINLSNRDATLLKKYYNRCPDMILPITLDDSFAPPNAADELSKKKPLQLLFVGSLIHSNKHGVTWFVKKVMPYVDAELTVVGKNFEKMSGKLKRKNVNVIGTVDDVSGYYHQAHAVVFPVRYEGGMKVKMAEALMYGKPTFATDEILEGYMVEGVANIYRCNTAKQFINAINSYADKEHYETFDETIRALFLERYHTSTYVPKVRGLLRGLIEGGRGAQSD